MNLPCVPPQNGPYCYHKETQGFLKVTLTLSKIINYRTTLHFKREDTRWNICRNIRRPGQPIGLFYSAIYIYIINIYIYIIISIYYNIYRSIYLSIYIYISISISIYILYIYMYIYVYIYIYVMI